MQLKVSVNTLAIATVLCLCFFYIASMSLFLQFKHATRYRNTASTLPLHDAVQCFILTLDRSLTPITLSGQIICNPFYGRPFDRGIWNLVSSEMQNNLRNNINRNLWEFSVNASASIAYNHRQIWKHVAVSNKTTLVLEDDFVMHSDSVVQIGKILHAIQNEHNYILKLHDHSNIDFWTRTLFNVNMHLLHEIESMRLFSCLCMPGYVISSTTAYIIDPIAAQTLLDNTLPLGTHIDVDIYFKACRDKKLSLFKMDRNVVLNSGRPSLNVNNNLGIRDKIVRSFVVLFLQLKERVQMWQNRTCM